MANIFTRNEVDKIIENAELTSEQKREQIFSLYGRSLDDGYVSRRAAEEAKQQAVEAAKAEIKIPEPVDPKTTPEYLEVVRERDMLRTIGGEEFSVVKPKFREQVFGMIDRAENAAPVAEQLTGIRERFEEYFNPADQPKDEPKNSPVYSQNPGRAGTNPESEEDRLVSELSKAWD